MTKIQDGMTLYHGSYCIVEKPDLDKCAMYKDFILQLQKISFVLELEQQFLHLSF